MMAAKKPTVTRVRIAREELEKMSKEDFHKCWNLQDQYIDLLEHKLNSNVEHTELLSLRESEEKLKQQQIDASRRENILVMRLTTKEHEMQEFAGQIQELKQAQVPTVAQLRSALLDPAVNLLFERMRKEMDSLKARLEETQNELSAWKFTPDSNTGKRLMAKCRLLYQENEELGKIISSGRMAKLEGDLALQKSFSEEMKKSQSDLDEFLLELDEDVEGMQSTIYYLQQQLRESKEQIQHLQKEQSHSSSISNGSPPLQNSEQRNSPHFKPISQARDVCSPMFISQPQDLNGTPIKPHPPEKDRKSQQISGKKLNSTVSKEIKAVATEVVQFAPALKEEFPSTESIAQSVIVVNHAKQTPVEKINQTVDTLDSRTNNLNVGVTIKTEIVEADETPVQNTSTKVTKKIPEATRGRKRTRPRTPVEPEPINEDNLPVRKRTRRREAEIRNQERIAESARTQVEFADTEVQVAQTLASWAATKQERTEIIDSSLGNGEVNKVNCGETNDS